MDTENPKKIIFEELNPDELDTKLYSEVEPFSAELEIYKDELIKTLMDIIGKEISKLPETQRDVLYGYYFGEKTLKQIALDLGLEENAVTLRKHRAIATLRRLLSENPYATKLYAQLREADPSLSLVVKLSEELQLKNKE